MTSHWALLGASIDLLHAATMVLWIVGVPLLFYRGRPSLRRAYAIYAVTFVALYQGSRWILGECFLTTLARWCWQRAPQDALGGASDEWFTVRIANAIFRASPSHRSITMIGQLLIAVTAIGVLYSLVRRRREAIA